MAKPQLPMNVIDVGSATPQPKLNDVLVHSSSCAQVFSASTSGRHRSLNARNNCVKRSSSVPSHAPASSGPASGHSATDHDATQPASSGGGGVPASLSSMPASASPASTKPASMR